MSDSVKMWRGDYDRIQIPEVIPPGYKVAHMIASLNGKDAYRITFAISPSSLNESRTNNYQVNKTNGGWFAQRMGPNPMQVSIDGYMLDIEGYLEKHQFLWNWKNFLEDRKVNTLEYENSYTIRLICMGRAYYGAATSISISSSGMKPFLHQYQMSFMIFKDEYIYKPNEVKVALNKTNTSSALTGKNVGSRLYSVLTSSVSNIQKSVTLYGRNTTIKK